MKIKIQSILASLLAVSLLTCSASAMSFPDVPEDSDYATAIENISDLKIMVGDTQGNFNPNQIVSRAEMATIVCRVLGITENLPKSEVFDDVPTTFWANAYIGKASELGIVAGYGNRKFGPGDPVTYEQAITMVVRAIGQSDRATSYGGYPNGFIQVAEESSLLQGIQAIQGQGMTRGAVAMLLYNYYITQNNPDNPGTSSNMGEHTHNYVTQAREYTEQRQIGTKTVNDYAQVTLYGCSACDFTTYDPQELLRHNDARFTSGKCMGVGWWSKTTTEVVGTHEEPVYSTRTVSELVRVCSICGQQEP